MSNFMSKPIVVLTALVLAGFCSPFAKAVDTASATTDVSNIDYAKEKILTPPPSPAPRINGAKVFGARPGSPFLYQIAASGTRPMTFAAEGLPAGLTLDVSNGRITGIVATAGSHRVKLSASNAVGSASAILRIEIGEELCLTPPMGWSSWYAFGAKVNQQRVLAVADAMVKSGLAEHGWSYINIDDGWQGARGGEHNALQGNEKFPDMKALCEHIHSLGLKAGI